MNKITAVFLSLFLLVGCATRPTDPDEIKIYEQNNDPMEPMNRSIFAFNRAAHKHVLSPAVKGYRRVVPETVRTGIGNFFTNLKQPIYLVNAVLQWDWKAAGQISGRFATNTLVGFFGVLDTATDAGIPIVERDFGQTLAVWGVKNGGPYLMLPILGPSTVRDTVGMGVDAFADPVTWELYDVKPWLSYTRTGSNGFVQYENKHDLLENMEKNSTDYYATMRSMYQQNRQKEISELRGEVIEVQAEYDFDFPDEEEGE